MFDHFVGLALKGLMVIPIQKYEASVPYNDYFKLFILPSKTYLHIYFLNIT